MTNRISSEQAFEHAWKYFELHSSQRTTLFNYFLFIIAGLGAGIGANPELNKATWEILLLAICSEILVWKGSDELVI